MRLELSFQCHGKVGNFEAPVELLAKSKKDKWYYQQWNRFAPGMRIMNNGVEIKSKKLKNILQQMVRYSITPVRVYILPRVMRYELMGC